MAVDQWYDFHEFGCHLGNVGLCDEVDRYPSSAGTEGDPIRLAAKRATTFWNAKVVTVLGTYFGPYFPCDAVTTPITAISHERI